MTHRCFCGSTGESTRCSTFWLWSEVRAWPLPNLSLYPQTYTSAYWNGKNWLYYPKLEYYFDSKVILIDHSTICFFFPFCCRHHVIWRLRSFKKKKKKNITGVTVLPLEWVGLFAWHVAVNRVSMSAPRVNTPAFTSSLALIISLCPLRGTEEHTHVFMFVCHCRGFHGYHTDTGAQRSEATSASVGPRWIGLTPVRGRTEELLQLNNSYQSTAAFSLWFSSMVVHEQVGETALLSNLLILHI